MYKQEENIWDVESNNNYEKVSDFIDKKIKKINIIRQDLTNIKELFKEYMKITKKYCNDIALLALKLKPFANTIEGDLTQAIQSIILFNSVSLESLVKGMEQIYKVSKVQKESSISGLEEFYKIYQINLSDLLTKYCIYIEEIENYEKYLMNKEMGLNNDVNVKQVNLETPKSEKRKSVEIKEQNNENNNNGVQNKIEKLENNLSKVLETRDAYFSKVEPMNDIINKLVEYGINQEKLLNEEFFNISKMFVDKLNECLDSQKKKNEDQAIILSDLRKKINNETLENLKAETQQYSLHCLSIYINAKNIARKKTKDLDKNLEKLNQKSEKFKIYKNITLENVENVIKEMQKNGLKIKQKDLEDFQSEKVKDFIERKCQHITDNTDENFTESDKNELIKYFQEKDDYILFFLQKLNNDRARGGEISNKNIFNSVGEIFKCINDIILTNQDYKCFKYISIISMTYFISQNNKKIYVYEFIKDNEKLKSLDFWKKYSEVVIELDIKSDMKKKEELSKEKEKMKKNFAAFSNILTITNNMVNFGFDDDLVNNYISYSREKFSLNDGQMAQINELYIVWKSSVDTKEENKDKKEEIKENKEEAENKKDETKEHKEEVETKEEVVDKNEESVDKKEEIEDKKEETVDKKEEEEEKKEENKEMDLANKEKENDDIK
jgi:hypothetical protein